MSAAAPTVRIGIIGCGQWGRNHLRNFSAAPDVEVVWCCDTSDERLRGVHRLYPMVRITREPSDVWNDPTVNAVVIATPSVTHYDVARAALEHGKDVLCEKPLTTTAAHSEELVQLAADRQRILMVGHVFVFNPAIQKLREFMAQGLFGRLYYFSSRRTNLGPIRADVDAVWDLASHDLSIFDYLLNGAMPLCVSAYGGAFLTSVNADVSFITLEYPDHVVANVQVSWLDPQKRRELTVVGSDQMAIFNDVSIEAPLWLYDKGAEASHEPYESFEKFRFLSWERDARVPNIPRAEPLVNETRHFLDCVRQRSAPHTDGANGLRIVRILEAISQSMRQSGVPVRLEAKQA